MAQITESPANPTQQNAALRAGMETLDLSQVITFQAYTRVVLPIDGFIFWQPTVPFDARGSLHYAQEIAQNEDETVGLTHVTFTSEDQITEFVTAPIDTIYVATVDGFRFAFSKQGGFYTESGIWHYQGAFIYPALSTQLLDPPTTIDPTRAITSNSLALWLQLNNYVSLYYDGFSNTIPLYPSQLVPTNLEPVYGVVHIGENDTKAIQATPFLDRNRNHYQLVQDHVRITLYGLQHNEAMDFVDCVNAYSVNTDNFGLTNLPVIRDAKRTQAELTTIAMKKVIEYDISYNQARVADVGRQLILNALPIEYFFFEGVLPSGPENFSDTSTTFDNSGVLFDEA